MSGNYENRLLASSCLYVRLSVHPHGKLCFHWKDFSEILYLGTLRKSVQKIRVLLKSDKNNIYFTWRLVYIVSCWTLLRKKNISHRMLEKMKTHISCSITLARKSCHLWDNVKKYGAVRQVTDDNITDRMRIACWLPKATNTHPQNM